MRRVGDMHRLKTCLERLKCDLHVLYLSKKLNKESDAAFGDKTNNTNEDGMNGEE